MKQVASAGALTQVLRALPPKNEASGFAQGSEASEASSFGASPLKLKQVASPDALKQVKLVASELRPLKLKQVASPEALKQVKPVASELRAAPPKNEASGFARGSEASEASSFGASRFAP